MTQLNIEDCACTELVDYDEMGAVMCVSCGRVFESVKSADQDDEWDYKRCPDCESWMHISNVWPHDRYVCGTCGYVDEE